MDIIRQTADLDFDTTRSLLQDKSIPWFSKLFKNIKIVQNDLAGREIFN